MSGVFFAVSVAIQPRLLSSPATKNSPAMPVLIVSPRLRRAGVALAITWRTQCHDRHAAAAPARRCTASDHRFQNPSARQPAWPGAVVDHDFDAVALRERSQGLIVRCAQRDRSDFPWSGG